MIPPKWDVQEATITRNGELVYDGTWHPLAVIALSASFEGKVPLDVLREHLHYDHRYDDSLTFHFRQQFRTWDRDWGFCVPKDLYDALEPGEYDVKIVTHEAPGALKVLVGTHPARSPIQSHCARISITPASPTTGWPGWPWVSRFSDDSKDGRTNYTYKLGARARHHWYGVLPRQSSRAERRAVLECLCLWMLGSRTKLALQESRGSRSNMEHAIARAMDDRGVPYRRGEFESIIINDEYLWEAYGIPTCSLSRFPYPEYHSSRDDVSIMSEEQPRRGGRSRPRTRSRSSRRPHWWRSGSRARSACPTRATTCMSIPGRSPLANTSAIASAGFACCRTSYHRCRLRSRFAASRYALDCRRRLLWTI